MLSKRWLFLIVSLSSTLALLCACTSDDESASKSVKPAKKVKGSSAEGELDRLLLEPPQLSLSEGINKYAASEDRSMTPQKASLRLSLAAKRACDMGDNDAAEILLNEAIRLDNNNGEAYYQRGRARCNSVFGKDKAAIDDLKKAISLGCGGARAYQSLARLYDADGQPLKAIEQLNIAVKLSPTEKDYIKSRAAVYAAIGQKEKALEDYQRLAELQPDNVLPYFCKGQILESMKRFDEASSAYTKLVSLDETKNRVPLKALSYKRLAILNSARGKHNEAIANLNEAMKLDATDDEPLRLRGLEYAKLKNYKQALDDLTKAIELSTDTKDNYEARAVIYSKLGRTIPAEADRAEAKKLDEKPAERPMYEMKENQF